MADKIYELEIKKEQLEEELEYNEDLSEAELNRIKEEIRKLDKLIEHLETLEEEE